MGFDQIDPLIVPIEQAGFVSPTDDTPEANFRLTSASPFVVRPRGEPTYGIDLAGSPRNVDPLDIGNDDDTNEAVPLDMDGFVGFVDLEDTVVEYFAATDLGCYELQICDDCAGERVWINTTGGEFRDQANWDPGRAGVGNTAVFNLPAFYTVTTSEDVATAGLRVRDVSWQLDLTSNTYVITDYPDRDAPGVPGDSFRGLVVGQADAGALTITNGIYSVVSRKRRCLSLRRGQRPVV